MGKLSIDGKGAFDTRLNSFIGLHEMGKERWMDGVSGYSTAQHELDWTQDGQHSIT
jgi:hypothetical protein